MLSRVPPSVLELCRRLAGAGFEAWLVGGGVRDLLLGREVHDWDVATAAQPEQVQRVFRRTVPTGVKHGTVTVLLEDGGGVEVTTFRGEGAYSDGRHPDGVVYVRSLVEDLERRDFTMNAMALDPTTGEVADPFGGRADLDARLVRAVGDPGARFSEDGLRCLRAVRFAAVLGFEVEPATLAAIGACLPTFRRVSAERVRDELLKLLGAAHPSVGLELVRRSGLLADVLPELAAGIGLAQNRHHSEDVWAHSVRVCDGLGADDRILRLAGLLHDVGKVGTVAPAGEDRPDENTFHGHESEGARLVDEVIGPRLRLSNEDRGRVAHLVACHNFPLEGWTGAGRRRFLRRVGTGHLDALLALKAADLGAKPGAEERLARLARLREELEAEAAARPALETTHLAVDGRALMAHLDLPPGPRVGRLLRALLERVLEDPALNERERLLALAAEIAPGL
jgi:tRNA nucleotidyltransferase (CCA-adding enzyme)